MLHVFCSVTYGYKENIHSKATEKAVKALSFNGYITEYLGLDLKEAFSAGLFDKKSTNDRIQDGGVTEDNFPRFRNHFFDPITEKGIYLWLPLGQQNSSLVWGKNGGGSLWSWGSAREYYYEALTSTQDHDRKLNLANTFRAVGQVMHLVEDLASPPHVRNDIHFPIQSGKDFYEEYADNKFDPVDGIIPYDSYAPVDLTTFSSFEAFWKNNGKGLAEFTNKNFLSRDTNLDDKAYPLPFAIGEWVADEMPDPKGKPIKVLYQKGYVTDAYRPETSAHINKLSAYSYFDFEMKKRYPDSEGNRVFTLNDSVYREYAQFLVPRAVGYAAGILNYFFRGTMTLEPVTGGVTFRTVRIMAKNDTFTGEEMSGGEYTLVIRYRAMTESGTESKRILRNPDNYYSYKVAKIELPTGISKDGPVELTFDFSTNPLPAYFDDLSMQLIYKGKLGNEEGAVAVSPLKAVDIIYPDFQLSLPSSGIYAKTSGNTSDATFDELRVKALTNMPGGLSIPAGRFELAIKYRTASEDPFQSFPVDSVPTDDSAYIIRVSEKNGVATLPQGVPVELVFNLSTVPLPVKATDLYLNVYYIADVPQKINSIGYLDISEPTPVDVFNNTNKVCINQKWYDAGSDEAITAVGKDIYGNPLGDIFPHNIGPIYFQAGPIGSSTISATPTNNNLFFAADIAPGQMQRLGYILTDYQLSFATEEQTTALDSRDDWTLTYDNTIHSGYGFVYQADVGFSGMYTIQGNKMWGGTGIIYDNETYPLDSTDCSWDLLP